MNPYLILYILFLHFIADFVLQSDAMAKSKSKHFDWLFVHCLVHFASYFFGLLLVFDMNQAALFAGITFFAHLLTDAITSRINGKLYALESKHWFFVGIGADQLSHAAQLILTLHLISK